MRWSIKQVLHPVLAVTIVLTIGIPQAFSSEIYQNKTYGYEFEPSPKWVVDSTAAPDVVVWSVGEGGRLVLEVIPFAGAEGEEAVPEDVVTHAKAMFVANFEGFYSTNEAWSTNRDGLQVFDIDFECIIDDEPARGTAKIFFGDADVVGVYYDDLRDFDYHIPDIRAAFDSLRIDKKFIDERAGHKTSATGKPVEFIDPMRSVYRNEAFGYTCENPGRLTPEEAGGPGWVVFPTGEGEAAVRFLDAYKGSGKGPDVYIKEMLQEILVSFSKFEITKEEEVKLNDGRLAYIVELGAVFNGIDWQGMFVGFKSDDNEPFLVKFLAPVEEYEKFKAGYETMWMSFIFTKDF